MRSQEMKIRDENNSLEKFSCDWKKGCTKVANGETNIKGDLNCFFKFCLKMRGTVCLYAGRQTSTKGKMVETLKN